MADSDSTTCAVVGGGPAGMVLGLLLARAGVEVTVFEKHGDFLRDFRGDTVHPVTLRLLDDLGLFPRFDALPHSKFEKGEFAIGGRTVIAVDFRRLHQPHRYIALVPQWDLLDLLADAGREEPTFSLRMQTEVTGLLTDGDTVTGVRYEGVDGPGELRADLTVACDGRTSVVRREARLVPREFPVPFDVGWFRLEQVADVNYQLIPRFSSGLALILIPREGYFQAGCFLPKGGEQQLHARGLDEFRAEVAALVPEASVASLQSWNDVKVLDVRVNRLRRWYRPGLLCIGDAAHAMSPVGGVGINLAVADAVAAAGILAEPLKQHRVGERDLAAVQRRRNLPAIITQGVQRMMHRVMRRVLLGGRLPTPPPFFGRAIGALLARFPALSVIPAYKSGSAYDPNSHRSSRAGDLDHPLAEPGPDAAQRLFNVTRRACERQSHE
jgi:2-polyprenyl-6-methoxyphenol hydroxylase-like FAD-dependent oxidoreductase